MKSAAVSQKGAQRDRAQAEKLAMEAAERGDSAALQRLAKELRDWKESKTAVTSGSAPVTSGRYESPIDLAAPFAPKVVERARAFGLAEARTAPYAEFAKAREIIYMHVDQPLPAHPDMEGEGVLHARTMAVKELPVGFDSEEPRILAGQFIQQIFVNSEERAIFLRSLTKRCWWRTSTKMNRRLTRRQICWRRWGWGSTAAFPAWRSRLRSCAPVRKFLRIAWAWIP